MSNRVPTDYEACGDCGFDHAYEPEEAKKAHEATCPPDLQACGCATDHVCCVPCCCASPNSCVRTKMITKEEIIALLGELPDDARIGGFVIVATKENNMVSSSHLLDVEDCHGVCKHSIIKEVEEAVKEWRGGTIASGMSN